MATDRDSKREFFQSGSCRGAFNLGPVPAGMGVLGLKEPAIEAGLVAQEKKTLGVRIEPSKGINIFWESKLCQGTVG